MKSLNLFLCAVCIAAVSTRVDAQVLYGATSAGGPGELYILNPANGAVVQDIGPLNDGSGTNYPMTGMAFNPTTGILYGSTGNSVSATAHLLVTINPATGLVTPIGSFNAASNASMADLAFTPSGNLYGIATNGGANLNSINTATGQATQVGPSGFTGTSGGGLAISAAGLFYGSPNSADFGTYDPTTGAYTNIGDPGHPAGANTGYAALAFDNNGNLYGDDLGGPPHLVIIDPATANTTDLGSSVTSLDAIAFSPAAVPEPGTMALLLAPMAAGLLKLSRRRKLTTA